MYVYVREIALFVCLFSLPCEGIDYEDCGSHAEVLEVGIGGCDAIPCQLSIASMESKSLEVELYNVVFGLGTEVTEALGANSNGCQGLVQGNCPLGIGETALYAPMEAMIIPNSFPLQEALFEIHLINEEALDAVCVRIPVLYSA